MIRFDRAEGGKGFNITLQAKLGGIPSPPSIYSKPESRTCRIHISWFSGINLNTHMRIHATVAGQILLRKIVHYGRFQHACRYLCLK